MPFRYSTYETPNGSLLSFLRCKIHFNSIPVVEEINILSQFETMLTKFSIMKIRLLCQSIQIVRLVMFVMCKTVILYTVQDFKKKFVAVCIITLGLSPNHVMFRPTICFCKVKNSNYSYTLLKLLLKFYNFAKVLNYFLGKNKC